MGHLILQHDQIPRRETGKHLVNVFAGDLPVGACHDDDAVFPLPVHLDHGMAVGGLRPAQQLGADIFPLHGLQQHPAVGAQHPGEPGLAAGTGQRHRLVKSLSPAEPFKMQGGDGLLGSNKILHLVGAVDIQ